MPFVLVFIAEPKHVIGTSSFPFTLKSLLCTTRTVLDRITAFSYGVCSFILKSGESPRW
jgi:hypothetical protein